MSLQIVAVFLDLIYGDVVANDTQCRIAAHKLLEHNSMTRRVLDKITASSPELFAQNRIPYSLPTISSYVTRFELMMAPQTLTSETTRECMSSILTCTSKVLKNEIGIAERLKSTYRELLNHQKNQASVEHYTALYDALRDATVGFLEKVKDHDNLAALHMDRVGVHLRVRHTNNKRTTQQSGQITGAAAAATTTTAAGTQKRDREERASGDDTTPQHQEQQNHTSATASKEQQPQQGDQADNVKTTKKKNKSETTTSGFYLSDGDVTTTSVGSGPQRTSSNTPTAAAAIAMELNDLMCPPSEFERVHPSSSSSVAVDSQQVQQQNGTQIRSNRSSPSGHKKQQGDRTDLLTVAHIVPPPIGALSQASAISADAFSQAAGTTASQPRRQLNLPREMPLAAAVLGEKVGGFIASSSEADFFSVSATASTANLSQSQQQQHQRKKRINTPVKVNF